MSRESKRPGNTVKWEINSPLTIHVQQTDKVEYATVNKRGDTIHRIKRHGKATVILGHREETEIIVTPEDTVFTCLYGSSGHLSTLPPGYADKEVTIISHNVEMSKTINTL